MQFLDNHIDSARNYFLEALAKSFSMEETKQMFRIVLAHIVKIEFSKTLPALSSHIRFSESEILKLLEIIKRLKAQEPLQYILNEAWFYDIPFTVNKAVLIPRQETEMLVHETLNWLKQHFWAKKVLDIGTGSGCIPITIAKENPALDVYALDYSSAALAVAANNAEKIKVDVTFQDIDILKHEAFNGMLFDVIVSNPPYICEQEKVLMTENVLSHEPDMALFVPNESPLIFYVRIAEIAARQLTTDGFLMVEINEHYGKETLAVFANSYFRKVELVKDLNGKNRFVKAIKA